MTVFTIDCAGIENAQQLWQLYVDVVSPLGAEHFGRNLDALWDGVQWGGPGDPGAGAKIVFINSAALAGLRTNGGKPFLDALRQLAIDTDRVTIEVR